MLLDFNKFSFVLFGSMVRAEGHGRVEREEYEVVERGSETLLIIQDTHFPLQLV